jgi:lipoprotein NlpD
MNLTMNFMMTHCAAFASPRIWLSLTIAAILAGCAASSPAPVTDARPTPVRPGTGTTPNRTDQPAKPGVTAPANPSTSTLPSTSSSSTPVATATPLGGIKPLEGTPLDSKPLDAKPLDTKPTELKPGEVRPIPANKLHVVQRSETVRSIATQYGLDFRQLGAWNNLENPNLLKVGDTLRLAPPDNPSGLTYTDTSGPSASGESTNLKPSEASTAPFIVPPGAPPEGKPLSNSALLKVDPRASKAPYSDQTYARMVGEAAASGSAAPVLPLPGGSATTPPAASATTTPAATATTPGAGVTPGENVDWAWPLAGKTKVNSVFSEASKGIVINGARGTPILAAAPGRVIHSQSVLRGYGKLIIIKHNENWLSAYAHNDKVMVKEGEDVKRGQKIAEMGSTDAEVVKLHFEIRKQGKPVDPAKYLPAQ